MVVNKDVEDSMDSPSLVTVVGTEEVSGVEVGTVLVALIDDDTVLFVTLSLVIDVFVSSTTSLGSGVSAKGDGMMYSSRRVESVGEGERGGRESRIVELDEPESGRGEEEEIDRCRDEEDEETRVGGDEVYLRETIWSPSRGNDLDM